MNPDVKAISLIFSVIFLIFLGCLSPLTAEYTVPEEYRIKAGDLFSLEVVSLEEFYAQVPVSADGYLSLFPFAESIKAAGLTLQEAKELIRTTIRKKYVNAVVNAELIEISPQIIHFKGALVKAGPAVVESFLPLTEVIGERGGLLPKASRKIRIMRQGNIIDVNLNDYYRLGDKSQNPILIHNDTVLIDFAENYIMVYTQSDTLSFYQYYETDDRVTLESLLAEIEFKPQDADYSQVKIKRNGKILQNEDYLQHYDKVFLSPVEEYVYVAGSVNNPGGFQYRANSSINYYIGLAGGVSVNGNMNRIFIVNSDGSSSRYKGQPILSGDTIYVPQKLTANLREWLTPISSVLSVITTIIVLTR